MIFTGVLVHFTYMCISRDGDQATVLAPAESCRDRSPLRARLGDGAMWSLKSQPGLVYICLLENREQMHSNTLLLCGDAALAGCSGICSGFLPLIYPPQFTFSLFLFLAFIFNFHAWLYGVSQVDSPTKISVFLHQANSYCISSVQGGLSTTQVLKI